MTEEQAGVWKILLLQAHIRLNRTRIGINTRRELGAEARERGQLIQREIKNTDGASVEEH